MNRVTTRLQIFIIIFLLVILLVGIFYTYNTQIKQSANVEFIGTEPIEGKIFKTVAYISGSVKNPGVYAITENTRLSDLVSYAGGITDDADTQFINEKLNLSQIVEDETHIFIPHENHSQPSSSQSGLTNINSALSSQLESLPGIGPSTASKIISNRPYSQIEDLLNVSGIGPAKFEAISELITVE